MPPLNPSDGLLVLVVSPPWVTDTVTSPDRSAELAVNSIISSVPPPETGMFTLPRYWKSVKVADPAVSTEAAAEAVMPDGAAAFFLTAFLPLAADLAAPVDVPLGDGEALADVDGDGVAEGADPDWPAEGVGDGLAEADGADGADEDDADGVGLGDDEEGVGVGDERRHADDAEDAGPARLRRRGRLGHPAGAEHPGHQEGRHRGDRQRPVPGGVADARADAVRGRRRPPPRSWPCPPTRPASASSPRASRR